MDKSQSKAPCFLCGETSFSWGFVTSYTNQQTMFKVDDMTLSEKVFGTGGNKTRARRCNKCGNILLFDASFTDEN